MPEQPHKNDTEESMFNRLYEKYRLPVFSYICTITGDHYAGEDLTQELFIRLWKKKQHFGEIQNMEQYIFRMAHNACMNWFRKLALDAKLIQEVKNRLNTEANNVADHIAHEEAKLLLEKALETLSPQRRKVFLLSRREGLKLTEIAAVMRISFHTANHHLVAALAQLREYFGLHTQDKILMLLALLLIG